MSSEQKKKPLSPEEFKKLFDKLPEEHRDKPNTAWLCPHCLKFFGKRVSRFDVSHMEYDKKTGESRKIICNAEKEFWLQKHYDTIIQRIPLSMVPETTPLAKLFLDNKTIDTSFIVGDYESFCFHFKSFLRHAVWDKRLSDFSYEFVTFPMLKNLRWTPGESKDFSVYDDKTLIIFDLSEEARVSVEDDYFCKEFIVSRERKFLPIWVLSPTERITNHNLKDTDLRDKIHAYRNISILGDDIEIESADKVKSRKISVAKKSAESATKKDKESKNKKVKTDIDLSEIS